MVIESANESTIDTLNPASKSIAAMVVRRWKEIHEASEKLAVRPLIDNLEQDLLALKDSIGVNADEIMFRDDLRRGRILHKENLIEHEYFIQRVSQKYLYLEDIGKTDKEYAIKVTLAAFQINFAINSAVAIAALNGIFNGSPSKFLSLLSLACSIVGIVLTGASHWLLAEKLTKRADLVKQHLSGDRSLARLKVLAEDPRLQPGRWDDLITRCSIAWTGVYLVGCVVWAMFLAP